MATPGIYSGQRTVATVPDTLDLADRAELAINGLGGTLDPELHFHQYFYVHYCAQPPFMKHHSADTTCGPKFTESFPLMRLMCGSDRYLEVEEQQREAVLACIRDGLYWNRVDPERPWRATYHPDFDGEARDEDVANVSANGRVLRALVTMQELQPDSRWERPIRELVDGLNRIAVNREDYSYYPDGGFGEPFNYPRSGWRNTNEAATETEGGEGSVTGYQGHQIQGLARWYQLSGDEQALDLAGRLTRYCMLPRFWGGLPQPKDRASADQRYAPPLPDPLGVAGEELGHWHSHFHARAIVLRAILEYAAAVEDHRIYEFVLRAYEYSLTFGISRIGWINTSPGARNMMEGCALGDLVALGVRLSDLGIRDCWDDVDAIVRNHLVEGQLVDAEALGRVAQAAPEPPVEQISATGTVHPRQKTTERVIERSLGNFAGLSLPSSIPGPWVMQCCTGNGTQGLYYGWEAIVREDGDTTQVNLPLNRSAKSIDVDSYLPHQGRVVMRNKRARRVTVRIPGWVSASRVVCRVDGAPRAPEWNGRFLAFGDLVPGMEIEVDFPITESSNSYTVNAGTPDQQTFFCMFRGSTLVDITPRDESPLSYPLYRRDGMRTASAPSREATRFVADRLVRRW